MEFIIGIDKFPLIKFDNNKYTHILPVTKYQFERYMWKSETAPNIDYDELIKTNPRISPDEVNKKRLKHLFMTGITFTEARNYAAWIGGRLPVRDELEDIYPLLRSLKVVDIFDSIKNSKDIDKRCPIVLSKILSIFPHGTAKDIIENSNIQELCSAMSCEPYCPIYTKNRFGWPEVMGDDACDSRIEDAVFRVIIDKDNI